MTVHAQTSNELSITSPSDGHLTSNHQITISGTAQTNSQVDVMIFITLINALGEAVTAQTNSQIVTADSQGEWSIDALLAEGDNMITVSNDGASVSVTVTLDTRPPTITLLGDDPQIIELGAGYTELGATADDGSEVFSLWQRTFADVIGKRILIEYHAMDEAGNVGVAHRHVNVVLPAVDILPPTIVLPGYDSVNSRDNIASISILFHNYFYDLSYCEDLHDENPELSYTILDRFTGEYIDAIEYPILEYSSYILSYTCTDESGLEAEPWTSRVLFVGPRETSASEQRETSASEQRETSASEQRETSASEQRETSASEQRETSASEQRETSASEQRETSASEQRETSASEQRETSASEQRETSASEQRETSASEQRETSASEQRETSASEQRETSAPESSAGKASFVGPRETSASEQRETSASEQRETSASESSAGKASFVGPRETSASEQRETSAPDQYPPSLENNDKKMGGGDSNDWEKKPTFGKSFYTHAQIVEDGFSFNGLTLDITDNWHTDFDKTSSIIGETNHVELKVYADTSLRSVTLQLGIPEIGQSHYAETGIHVLLSRNYTNPNNYDITDVIHEQKEPLINEKKSSASIIPSKCTSSDRSMDERCHTISFDFTMMAPLKWDVVAIKASDFDRYSTTTFINEGVEFTGESLLSPKTHTLMEKTSAQERHTVLELTQMDRRHAVYEDQFGNIWEHNDYGTWKKVTPDKIVRDKDPATNVMTRYHSSFDSLVLHEIGKATKIFDSDMIQSQVGDSFTYEYPTGDGSRTMFLKENNMMWIRG